MHGLNAHYIAALAILRQMAVLRLCGIESAAIRRLVFHTSFIFYIVYIISLHNSRTLLSATVLVFRFMVAPNTFYICFQCIFHNSTNHDRLTTRFYDGIRKKIVGRFGAPENDSDTNQNCFSCILHGKSSYLRNKNKSSTRRFE